MSAQQPGQAEEAAILNLIDFTYQAQAATWTIFSIATITFGLRTVSRLFFTTKIPLGWEDAVITISWLMDVVRIVTFQVSLVYTRHLNPADGQATIPPATFWAFFSDSWAFLSVTLPKVGVAILLIRIFRPRPWVRRTLLGSSLILFVICIAGFIICFVQCNPVPGQWDPYTYPDTKCWPRDVQIDYSITASSFSAALDAAFAIYPAVAIFALKMPLWKRLSTMALMGLGLAAFSLAVVKVHWNSSLLGNPNLIDLYIDALHIGLWNSVENDFVLIAACLPSVPPVFVASARRLATLRPKSYLSYRGSHDKSHFDPLGHNESIPEEYQLYTITTMRQVPPAARDGAIQVQYEISLERGPMDPVEGRSHII